MGLGRKVLENAIATNKRMWAFGESNCDCVKKKKREREREGRKEAERQIRILIFPSSCV